MTVEQLEQKRLELSNEMGLAHAEHECRVEKIAAELRLVLWKLEMAKQEETK